MKNEILQGKKIVKKFLNNLVLDNIDVTIYEKDFTVIMGASGAGKSTLLYALSGMDKITSGEIVYKNKKISSLNEKQMATLRANEFGFIFQDTHLVSNLSMFENVVVAGYLDKGKSQGEIQKNANDLLKRMNVENAKNRFPSQSSGGEKQRVAVARSLINNPGIVFADEPTGALNKNNSEEVLNLLSDINKEGQAILMVTHDVLSAMRGNRILYLEDGKIIGELNLSEYDGNNLKERESKINTWLSDMKW